MNHLSTSTELDGQLVTLRCLCSVVQDHYCLVSDNVVAVSVAIASAVANSINSETMFFHVITDSVAYSAMQARNGQPLTCSRLKMFS